MWHCIGMGIFVTCLTKRMMECLPEKPHADFVIQKISINALTLLVNVIARLGSKFDVFNFPEFLLHSLSLIGGAPATALSMLCINHKSTHTSYQDEFVWVCCGQVILEVVVTIYLHFYHK